jgi:hypothetical protein
MSTALAIASVTAVLRNLLNNGLIHPDVIATVGNVSVTALPPDRIDASSSNQQSQLNLFMYQVAPNQGWRNAALPSRDSRGDRITNAPLALDLHYLLTAYGASEFHCEILLGFGMQILHEIPVLARDTIRRALGPEGGLPPEMQALFSSELAEQVELIKLTPLSISTEEISRLWTAFQARYRPTAAYQASVVLIESRRSTRSALPVRGRKVVVVPFEQPRIEQILSQAGDGAPDVSGQFILAGHNLVILGTNLHDEDTLVKIDDIEVIPENEDLTDTRVVVPVPLSLEAGIHGAQVVHRTLLGSPPVPHRGVESNVAAFVLHPEVLGAVVSGVDGTGDEPRSADVTVTINPAVGLGQRVLLLLNEFDPPPGRAARAYGFLAPVEAVASPPELNSPPAPEDIVIPIAGVTAGAYLVRVQVDGAESPLEADSAGLYSAPQVVVP